MDFQKDKMYKVTSKILESTKTLYLYDVKDLSDGTKDLMFSLKKNGMDNSWSNVWVNSRNPNYIFEECKDE